MLDLEISRLELVSLSYDEETDELVEGEILKTKSDLASGQRTLWQVVYGEALAVQSIVNSLTQFPTVEGVVFTVEGNRDIESWLRHIGNTGKPFREDLNLAR